MTARQKHDTGGSAEMTPIRPALAFPEVTSIGDPRLRAAFRKQIDALEQGFALSEPPIEPVRIPFGAGSLRPARMRSSSNSS